MPKYAKYLRGADVITFYPYFYYWNCDALLSDYQSKVIYEDLYIDLEEFKSYLREYKSREIDDLVLNIDWGEGDRAVELFDVCGSSPGVRMGETAIELNKVSFVLLKGKGTINSFEITGFRGYGSVTE